MRQLHVADANALGDGLNQLLRFGKAIHQRIGIERKGECHRRLLSWPGARLNGEGVGEPVAERLLLGIAQVQAMLGATPEYVFRLLGPLFSTR